MNFSLILRTYRQHMNITQEQTARMIRENNRNYASVNVISLHRWETGKVKPSLKKQCTILDSLGLDKCVGAIHLPESTELSDYLTERYDSHRWPIYVRNSLNCNVFSESSESLDDFPEYLLEMLERVYKEENPEKYLSSILEASEHSSYHTYFDESNTMIGHLFISSMSVNNFFTLSESDTFLPLSRVEKTKNILYVICRFSLTKQTFKEQLLKLIDLSYQNENIAFIYMRSYEEALTRCLLKTTDGCVLTKYNNWTGILISPKKLKLLYSVFKPSACLAKSGQCDVRTCYGS